MDLVEEIRTVVERERARFDVPGVAVAVVAGGEVLLADGFGVRAGEDPVTPSTLFMIASDTKAFAAATVCLLVEDGLLDLDAPVRDVLPWFAMHDDRVSGQVTARDLLAHRTGLPRHDFLTIGDGDFHQSNEEITRNLRHLEASRPFRQGFGYSNSHYAVAGHLVEVLTGQPWKDVVDDRILTPLGMAGSGTYYPELTKGDFAAPHQLVDGARVTTAFQTRPYDKPSGGIVSSAEDLARWLLARLGGGLLSDRVLALMHTPSVATPGMLPLPELHFLGYALGTMAVSYRGHLLHLHGGAQVGFAGQVLVVPGAGAGVAVETNLHGSTLPLALSLTIVDQLLGLDPLPWGERLAVAPPSPPEPEPGRGRLARDVEEYVGSFTHPAYGELSTVLRDGALAARFHGLDDELVLTHRDLDAWQLTVRGFAGIRIPVVFRSTADGSVADVTLGLEPELVPLVFTRG